MEIRVQRYESQVKLFLVLLVLFLVAVGVVGLNVLYQTQSLLLEEAEGRVTAATRAVQREIGESRLPVDSAAASSFLQSLSRAYALSSVEIVDLSGVVLASSQPWRAGVVDPVAADVGARAQGMLATGAVIREPDPVGDDPEYGPDRAEVLVFLPLGTGPNGPAALLKAGHEVMGVRTVARQIRSLAWMQAGTGLIVLALVFLFARWVLRPYRALRAAAAQMDTPAPEERLAPIDDPQDLVASFLSVLGKLKDQEAELERMRSMASPAGMSGLSRPMLDGLTSGVLIIGPDGTIIALNPAGEAILGLVRADAVGKDFREVFGGFPVLLAILKDGVEAGRTRARELVPYEGRPGAPGHLGVTVSSVPSDGGPGGGIFCLFSDLTEIRGLQERVRLKENLAGLGEMSAGIAHEFRNSLATILGYARLIGREAEDLTGAGGAAAARQTEHAGAIVREVESIGRIVGDFLRFARPVPLAATLWDPEAVLAEVAGEIARDSGRPGIAIVMAGDWPHAIRADELMLRQAFGNLLRNAVEAIPGETGLVTVTGSLVDEGGQLRVEVSDSGTGIPDPVLSRLFTPFVTTKDRGTGLGLALAQKAIVSHDGAIAAKNAQTGGACFTVILPLQASSGTSRTSSATPFAGE